MEQKVRREIIAWFWVGLVFSAYQRRDRAGARDPSASMEDTLLIAIT